MIASHARMDRLTASHRPHWALPIIVAICAVVFGIIAAGVALAEERQLQPAPPAKLIHPSRAMPVIWKGDLTVLPTGGWSPLNQPGENPSSQQSALSSLNLFDAFLDPDGPCPGGSGQDDTYCYRWYFGSSYVNAFQVGEADAVKDGAADHVEFAFYLERPRAQVFTAVVTGRSPDYGCEGYTLSAGVVFDLGHLDAGAYVVDSVLDDPDMFLPTYRQGAIGGIIAEDFIDSDGDGEPDTFVVTNAQFFQYGNKGIDEDNGPFDLAGSHGPIQWDDDNPRDGKHEPGECRNYAAGYCPDPLHWMVGLGDCSNSVTCPSDTCNGHETLTASATSTSRGCKVKAMLKHGDSGAAYAFVMPTGDCIQVSADAKGKAVVKQRPSASGKVEVQDCLLSASVECP